MNDQEFEDLEHDMKKERFLTSMEKSGTFFLAAAVVAALIVFMIRDHYRGEAIDHLATALDSQRNQTVACSKNPEIRKSKVCTDPVSPPSDQVIDQVQGPVGPVGATGSTGPRGLPGAQGIRGLQGIAGLPGAPGKNGKDGAPGKDGKPGPPGPAGRDGVDGQPGQQGAQGPVGPEGPTGPAGAKGDPGANGTDAVPFVFLFTIPASNPAESDHTYRCEITAPSTTFTCTQVSN